MINFISSYRLGRVATYIYVLLALTVLLPFLENVNKGIGYFILLLGSGFVGISMDWRKVRIDIFDLLFFMFLASAFISSVLSEVPARSLMETGRYVSYFLIFFRVRRLSTAERGFFIKVFMTAVVAVCVVLGLISVSYWIGRPLISLYTSPMNLFFKNYGHNRISDILIFGIPFVFAGILAARNSFRLRLTLISVMMFLMILMISSISRSGYIGLIFEFILFSMLLKDVGLNKTVNKMAVFVFPVVFLYVLIVFSSYFADVTRYPFLSSFKKAIVGDWRFEYVRLSHNSFMENPLFGTGLDSFRYLSVADTKSFMSFTSSTGENYFFTLLGETGVAGFLPLAVLLVSGIVQVMRRNGGLRENFLKVTVLTSALVTAVTVSWFFLSIYMYFWICLALLLPSAKGFAYSPKTGLTIRIGCILLIAAGITGVFSELFIAIPFPKVKVLNLVSGLRFYDSHLQYRLGKIAEGEGSLNAEHYYIRSIKYDKYFYPGYLALSKINFDNGKPKAASGYLVHFISLNPEYMRGYIPLLAVYQLEGILYDYDRKDFPAVLESVGGFCKLFGRICNTQEGRLMVENVRSSKFGLVSEHAGTLLSRIANHYDRNFISGRDYEIFISEIQKNNVMKY